ncbi:GNAT family N-acetyltransferase [Nakamurella endophytica]|nr:GNAT family N-acetyltransferase [Nakamurella endophytica]
MTAEHSRATPTGWSVEHLPDGSRSGGRFRALEDGREVAHLDYRPEDGAWDLLHTWADPSVRGTGVSSRLVTAVMDAAREAGVRIVPSCPYIPVWLQRHPGYLDLVQESA